MSKLSDLVKGLSEATGWEHSEIKQFARHAREGGYLTSGARGNAAPSMGAMDAANLLIALLAGTYAKDAPQTIERFCKLGGSPNLTLAKYDTLRLNINENDSLSIPVIKGDAGEIMRLPVEFSWVTESISFGKTLETLISMAISGKLQHVSAQSNNVYAFPRISVGVTYSANKRPKAYFKITDKWASTLKIGEISEVFGEYTADIILNEEVPILVKWFFEDGDDLEDLWPQVAHGPRHLKDCAIIAERRATHGLIERLGELLSR